MSTGQTQAGREVKGHFGRRDGMDKGPEVGESSKCMMEQSEKGPWLKVTSGMWAEAVW